MNAQRPRVRLSDRPLLAPSGQRLPSELQLIRSLHKSGTPGLTLAEFASAAWETLEPATPLQWNWHVQAVADHLEALLLNRKGSQGQPCPQNLLLNVPPGSMKSLLFSVLAPAWMWLHRPSWRAIYASGTPSVVTRDSLKCRGLIQSDWYQKTFVPQWKIASDQNEKQHFANTAGGFRKGVGAGAAVVGERADFLGVDDPNDSKEIHSKVHRETINDRWWDQAFHNRIADPTASKRGLIMQRLHEEDLAGYVLQKEIGQWAHLSIPMEHEAECPGDRPTWLGWSDPRKAEGELMFPTRFTPAYLASERLTLGSAGYAGQMQQRPVAALGNRFQRAWWRFWSPTATFGTPAGARPKGCSDVPSLRFNPAVDIERDGWLVIGSWDCTFKDGDDNDWVVGLTVATRGAQRLVLERFREHAGFSETFRAIARQGRDWKPHEILIEDKANGSAVIETLAAEVAGVIAVEPKGGKEARAAIMEPRVEAGNWYLPEGAPWLDEWVDEFAAFPRGKHDDQVDAASQVETRLLEDPDVLNARLLLGMG